MKNKELFEKTVSILVNAYMEDTLIKRTCAACAVGNLVAANLGINQKEDLKRLKVSKGKGFTRICGAISLISLAWAGKSSLPTLHEGWPSVFHTKQGRNGYKSIIKPENYEGIAKEQIDATGYTWKELAKIEYAFETGKGENEEEEIFKGLLNVYEALCEIHEVEEGEVATAKEVFSK